VLEDCRQGVDERVATLAEFVKPFVDDAFQSAPSPREQNDAELAMVENARRPSNVTVGLETIDQTHGAVMPEK